ncbi:uroporphyrinogen-III C-methyltransferase [Methylobacillus sp. MM3]|uniref:siroheme synthase CysG n=1 Tax=Methylobacillus sp. MM3 TaxID=1848039 RepID=UPI0007DE7E40|nr:siroheme synthase CysG [Methylobacillus sp. MM3]OAJ70258.1 uroporphyrinogen-III C-methyltransferase [Methylobacillus sp. MM3]
MDYLPIFMNLRGRASVVIGGGEVALRKIGMLLKADANVTVVSPELCPELSDWHAQGKVIHVAARFEPPQLDGAQLVIAATDDEEVNRQVSIAAQARNIPVNVVDAPELCTFVVPSVVDRSPIVIAVSSGGKAPVLARLVRARLETLIPASYGRLAQLAGEFRDKVKARFQTSQQRRIFWESVFQGPIAERVFSGQEQAARQELHAVLEGASDVIHRGEVYLVGGGPGDPDLLTFRALRLMQQCDVVVYDKLVSQPVMELVRRDAERIYVGKQRDQHTLPQEDINQLLVRLAKEGKRVLRLKGGDPFIFGRGGEEIETLMENGIPFQVVPGITAASGVASYAGIPLTHRDHAQSCVFATGHLRDGTVDLDWPVLARPRQTIVIYMGLVGLPEICRQLVAHGLPASTPAAVVQQGTLPQQRVVVSDLAGLAHEVEAAGLHAPCLTIIGTVVSLRGKLNWFEPEGD